MANVQDVAKYFLSLTDTEAGDLLSNLKLQKLCYYAQGFSLALNDRPLFGDSVHAWTHGPVIPSLYREYKVHGAGAIPAPEDFDSNVLDDQTRELLNEVFEVYGQYSAWKLRNMTHDEAPWVEAFQRGPGSQISEASLRAFFSTLVVH